MNAFRAVRNAACTRSQGMPTAAEYALFTFSLVGATIRASRAELSRAELSWGEGRGGVFAPGRPANVSKFDFLCELGLSLMAFCSCRLIQASLAS